MIIIHGKFIEMKAKVNNSKPGKGICFLIVFAGCVSIPGVQAQGKEMIQNVSVETARMMPNSVEKKYTGRVEAIDSVAIQPRVSGNILKISFKEGGLVKKGQVLFEIEDTQYKAKVQNVEAQIAQINSRMDYAKLTHERYERLVKSSSVAQDSVDSAKSALSALEAEKQAAEAELNIAKDNLDYTKITSPLGGRVGRLSFSEGNYITPASGSLLTVTSMDDVYVRFPISERDILSLFGNAQNMKKQAVVTLKLANEQPYKLSGIVAFADNQVKSGTGSMDVWAKFSNPEEELVPGGIVTVYVAKKEVDNYPATSISAVMHSDSKSFVYVLNDKNEVERREVLLGNILKNNQLFREGVREGDRVIVDGMLKTEPGKVVNPIYIKKENL